MDLSKLQNGSDVRGVALAGVENEPVTLDDAAVRAIAGGFARFLRARLEKESCRVSVGRDSRLSGGAIAETLCETLAACGAEVTDLGLCTTPAMFMTTVTGESPFDAAVMITASHLPWNRNGLKFFTAAGGAESADVREILRLAAEETPLAPGGSVARGEFMETYAAILREKRGRLFRRARARPSRRGHGRQPLSRPRRALPQPCAEPRAARGDGQHPRGGTREPCRFRRYFRYRCGPRRGGALERRGAQPQPPHRAHLRHTAA